MKQKLNENNERKRIFNDIFFIAFNLLLILGALGTFIYQITDGNIINSICCGLTFVGTLGCFFASQYKKPNQDTITLSSTWPWIILVLISINCLGYMFDLSIGVIVSTICFSISYSILIKIKKEKNKNISDLQRFLFRFFTFLFGIIIEIKYYYLLFVPLPSMELIWFFSSLFIFRFLLLFFIFFGRKDALSYSSRIVITMFSLTIFDSVVYLTSGIPSGFMFKSVFSMGAIISFVFGFIFFLISYIVLRVIFNLAYKENTLK